MDGVARIPVGAGHAARELPVHILMAALMSAVMAVTMVTHSVLASMAGAAVLVAASVVCSALSRSRSSLREHVVDLWAMALVLLAFLPAGPAQGHHAMSLPAVSAVVVVAAAWCGVRVALAVVGDPSRRRAVAASGAVTALGLVTMAVFCA